MALYVEFVNDLRLDPGPYDQDILINDRLKQAATPDRVPLWHDLVARWDLSDLSDEGVAAKVEEVSWLASLLAGATTRPGYKTRIDFFLVCLRAQRPRTGYLLEGRADTRCTSSRRRCSSPRT